MKKGTIITLVIVAVLAIIGVTGYNNLVNLDENVENNWAQVETQYQRRLDLIPNLVSVVKGYASHEKETFKGVVEARSRATQISIDPKNITPEKLAEFQKAQGDVSNALGKLLMIRENYPDLKANEQFINLQAQLEGTENRIAVARKDFNNSTNEYNKAIRRFPKNILAGIFGFDQKTYFKSDETASAAPKVEF